MQDDRLRGQVPARRLLRAWSILQRAVFMPKMGRRPGDSGPADKAPTGGNRAAKFTHGGDIVTVRPFAARFSSGVPGRGKGGAGITRALSQICLHLFFRSIGWVGPGGLGRRGGELCGVFWVDGVLFVG